MKLKKWELALFAAIGITLLCGTVLARGQQELADKLIRLHVIANSDSEEDQAVKLAVRDEVLSELEPLLEGVSGRDEAAEVIRDKLAVLREAARKTAAAEGYNYAVSAELGEENYPTREYDTFTLPAGQYLSLRIELGEGSGENWWCVVFPPMCADSPSDAKAALETLSDDEISLITEEDSGYAVKFKTLELIEKLRSRLR